MFSKISRYRRLPDVVTVDRRGRTVVSRSLRPTPQVSGRFLHTVQDTDRLDHLAFKYYEQPRDWWRILDANPAFLAPWDLLGTGARASVLVPVTWEGAEPPWSELLQALRRLPGMDEAMPAAHAQPHPALQVVPGPAPFALAVGLTAQLNASGAAQQVDPLLAAALAAEGVTFPGAVRIARPDATTWLIHDEVDRTVYTFRHFPDQSLLNVHASVLRHDWVLTCTHNPVVLSRADIQAAIAARGFAVGQMAEVHRVGKSIVIPPRQT